MGSIVSTGRLARFCARRPWIVVVAWVLAIVVTMIGAITVGGGLTDDDEFVGKPESVRGEELLREQMPGDQAPSELVIVRSQTLTVDDVAYRQTVEAVAGDLRGMATVVREAITYYDAVDAGDERAVLLVSPDRHTAIVPVTLRDDDEAFLDRVDALASQSPGYEVLTVGDVSFDSEESRLVEEDLIRLEVVGLPAALVVLVVVFGALVAAGVPLALALAAILGAVGLTLLLSRVSEMSIYAINMITMIGLAVGVDYALFVVDRYRENRRAGLSKLTAIEVAGSTASRAVLFSGGTVAIALVGVVLMPTTLFRSLGAGAILVVAVAVVATLTLVPAVLSLVGNRIDWPRRRRTEPPVKATQSLSGFWTRVAHLVMVRPLVSALLAVGVLLALALPYLSMERGTAGVESLPDSDVKRAYQILQQDFAAGLVEPLEIVVDAEREPEIEAALDRLVAELSQDDAFGAVTGREWNDAGTLAVVEVPLTFDGNTPEAYEAVERLREVLIPRAFAGNDAATYVTGETASNADLNLLIDRWTPRVFALVLGLSFLLLLFAFHSIVVPIKAIIMNLLSVGAAYGLMVLVFQKGYGTDFFGFLETPTIEAWLPIFLFCILFGLSMDYHVFLLSRIREYYDRTGDNRAAVTLGLQSTARIITGAAAIMVVVFAAFASGQILFFQQLGFGLAVAIILDATIFRSVLVPASMTLLGDRNWYLPRWLHWLRDLRIEGTPATSAEAKA